MKYSIFTILFLIFTYSMNAQNGENTEIDYVGFLNLTDSLAPYREARLIDENVFVRYSRDVNTIILDTRSKNAYDEIHVEGAVHLNFSDFTVEKLAKVIPNKDTRILIYCNNNFESDLPSLRNKSRPLALNIPTFINLFGYGYENIYELDGYLLEEKSIIPLERNF